MTHVSCRLIGLLATIAVRDLMRVIRSAVHHRERGVRKTRRSTRSRVHTSKICISGSPRGRPISASTSTTIGSTTTRATAVDDGVASARQFRERVAAIDAASLSLERQLDREQLLRAIDSRLLTLEVVRPWAVDPDSYSSGLTRTAYIMIKRNFAPPEERLRQLIAREKAMPAALAEARTNLQNPPRIYTEIAIEQMDGNRGFFETAVASAFPTVTDKALLAEFKKANDAVIAAMADYKKWLQDDLLTRSNGTFAIGEDDTTAGSLPPTR